MRLSSLCLLFALLPAQIVGQHGKPNPNETKAGRQEAANSENPSTQIIVQSQTNQQPSNQQDSTGKPTKQSFLPSPNTVSGYSTFFILLATIAYVIISACTLKKIGKQVVLARATASAASANAHAAQKGAQAAIDAERAWVDIRLAVERSDYVVFTVINYGKTPA